MNGAKVSRPIPWAPLLATLAVATGCAGAPRQAPGVTRPLHTFSIVARDPQTGEMGVAVQSHWFSVGSIVSWAEAGVGAVATQSFVDPAYGPRGLELMRGGLTELVAAQDQGCQAAQGC